MQNKDNARVYKIRIDGELFEIANPEPTGRELLALINKSSDDFYLTLVIAGQADLTVEADEPLDISAPGTEEFNLNSKARYFSIRINEGTYRVSKQFPTGRELLALVGKSPETHLLSLSLIGPDNIGADDPLIDGDEKIDLSQAGREQFYVIVRKPLSITIDDVKYTAPKAEMLGSELRQLVAPPVPSERDLWLDISGPDDQKVLDTSSIKLKDGMMFYTTPGKINPGSELR